MAVRPTSGARWILPAVVAAVVLLFVVAGAATQGVGGALVMLGLSALLLGAGAAITGRARWAFISSRRIAGLVAAAGIVTLAVGGIAAPPTTPTASSSELTAEATTESAAPTTSAEEAARAAEAAEAALADAETAERALPADGLAGSTGILSDETANSAVTSADRTSALAALAAVEVKGRAPRTGYDRDNFGSGWVDIDRNGCDTRNDMLARDLTGETFKPGTRNCVVLTGNLADPYSGGSDRLRARSGHQRRRADRPRRRTLGRLAEGRPAAGRRPGGRRSPTTR